MKTLLAGDHFVRNELLAEKLSAVRGVTFEFSELTLPRPPLTPFGRVAEVDEASDVEDALVPAANKHCVQVASTPGRNAGAAAEHAIALMMGALRKLPQLQRTLEQGGWRSDLYAYDECGGELDGSTVGLIGYGAIGSRVARVMLAFGAHVLVADPILDPASPPEGVEVVELVKRSDVVSLHARLTDTTAA